MQRRVVQVIASNYDRTMKVAVTAVIEAETLSKFEASNAKRRLADQLVEAVRHTPFATFNLIDFKIK